MSKRILWILTIALSLTLMGLILIQVSWIRNAVELKDKQFQQLVNNTLTSVSRQLDHYYTSMRMNMIIEERLSGDSSEKNVVEPGNRVPPLPLDSIELQRDADRYGENNMHDELLEIIGDSVILITHKGGKEVDTLHIESFQEKESRERLAQSLQEQQLMVATIMKTMLLENISFDERIEKEQLEKVLAKNLVDRGINLDFEYTVISDSNKELYTSDEFSRETDCYYFRTSLVNDEIHGEETYLYLYFPGQKALVRSSLGFLGSSTLILTLLMIILFTFALYVIFRQKRLSDIKNDFVNNMTHELKTPISTISLASQMLSDTSIPLEKKNLSHISKIIQTESKRLGYQVERVLQMAVLDQGHLVMKKRATGMGEIIANVVQNFKLQVENHQGRVEIVDESSFDMVEGDKVHLLNVVTNLMDNAIKYSREKPVITIRMWNDEKYFWFSVSDKGIGISKDNQKKVFERFYRVSTGNIHDVKGFGLGLSYVKLIVEHHGGSIALSSEFGKGTQFAIKLPLISQNNPDERD
ncbi:MAG: HAMP domain-containing histidine kinase [Bacteroidales bacterium]|nr:HAMP domain-containing histidine kinase [Bacteroidales bacterium]